MTARSPVAALVSLVPAPPVAPLVVTLVVMTPLVVTLLVVALLGTESLPGGVRRLLDVGARRQLLGLLAAQTQRVGRVHVLLLVGGRYAVQVAQVRRVTGLRGLRRAGLLGAERVEVGLGRGGVAVGVGLGLIGGLLLLLLGREPEGVGGVLLSLGRVGVGVRLVRGRRELVGVGREGSTGCRPAGAANGSTGCWEDTPYGSGWPPGVANASGC